MRKKAMQALSSALAASIAVTNGMTAYAAGGGNAQSVPVSITTEALTYDVTLSEALLFDFQDGVMDTKAVTVANNAKAGVVEVTGIKTGEMENGYALKAVSTEDHWKKLPLDTKEFALQYDGESTHDFSTGDLLGNIGEIDPEGNAAFSFTGFTSGTSEAKSNVKTNSLIFTMGFKKSGASGETGPSGPSGDAGTEKTYEWNLSATDADQVTGNFDPDSGTFTIQGSGSMKDFADPTDRPYEEIKDQITSVEVTGNVTNIGDNAFQGCENLTKITAPNVEDVGEGAFQGCDSLTSQLSFVLNGGAFNGSYTAPSTYVKGLQTSLPSAEKMEREYYDFFGWYEDADLNGDAVTKVPTSKEENLTYYAKWSPVSYPITYELNGGTMSGEKTSYNVETEDFTLPMPTRSGYTFTGWTGTGLGRISTSVTVTKGSHGERSYTANWDSDSSYTITLDPDFPEAGTASTDGTASVVSAYDSTMEKIKAPTKTGYTFCGYYTGKNGTGVQYYDASGNSTKKWDKKENTTLYAKWTLVTYSITYNLDGGTMSGERTSYNVESESFTLPTPKRSGYTFKGWIGSNGAVSQTDVSVQKGSVGDRSYTASWKATETAFLTGANFHSKANDLSGKSLGSTYNDYIKAVLQSEEAPTEENMTEEHIVSDSESEIPVYLWYEDGTIWWWSECKTPTLRDPSNTFYGYRELEDISGVRNWNIEAGSSLEYMFRGCWSLTSLDEWKALRELDTSSVTSLYHAFYDCRSLASIDFLRDWDVSSVTDFRYSFYYCNLIPSLEPMENWDVSSGTTFEYMFYSCDLIPSVKPLKKWNVSNATTFKSMFSSCDALVSLDGLEDWNVLNSRNFQNMFSGCSSLKSVSAIKDWKIPFYDCYNGYYGMLPTGKEVDFTHISGRWNKGSFTPQSMLLDLSATEDDYVIGKCDGQKMSVYGSGKMKDLDDIDDYLYDSCKAYTKTVEVSGNVESIGSGVFKGWDHLTKVTALKVGTVGKDAFADCDLLEWVDISNATSIEKGAIPSGKNVTMAVKGSGSIAEKYANANENQVKMKLSYMKSNLNSALGSSMATSAKSILKADTDPISKGISEYEDVSTTSSDFPIYMWLENSTLYWWSEEDPIVENAQKLFYNFTKLSNASGIKTWDFSNCEDFSDMFYGCSSLTDVSDLSDVDCSSGTNFYYTFGGCTSLSDLSGLSTWDVSNGTNFESMFYGCTALTSLAGLSTWNVSSGTNFESIFKRCKSLTDITALSEWDVSNSATFAYAFYECVVLKSLAGVEKWDIPAHATLNYIFSQCYELTDISALSGWDVSEQTELCDIFSYCYALADLTPLSGWDVSSVTNFKGCFYTCKAITDLSALKSWKTTRGTNFAQMFYNCTSLTDASGINNWRLLKTANFANMFQNCPSHPEFANLAGTWGSYGTFTPTS